MPTAAETAFMNDPKTFMEDNILRVICGKQVANQYNFSLVAKDNIRSRKTNRRGRVAPYYELTQADTGDVPIWFLPYADNDVRETTLPIGGANLMVTVQLNGCTFGHAQSGDNSGCYVTHHNARTGGNATGVIEAQTTNNPFDDDVPMSFFHQTQYRKVRRGQVDNRYYATLVGKRDDHNHWHFYAQKKKQLLIDGGTTWTLKGVVVVNP